MSRLTKGSGRLRNPLAAVLIALATVLMLGAPALAAAPDTVITRHPIGHHLNAHFAFRSDHAAATFECRLDDGAFAACVSPFTTPDLADGDHTFAVRAVLNGTVDPTPASFTWTVDATGPDVTITSGPPEYTNQPTATVEFSSKEGGATFKCKLDGSEFGCASPFTTPALAEGPHKLSIVAIDIWGKEGRKATLNWIRDTTRDLPAFTRGPRQTTSRVKVKFYWTTESPERPSSPITFTCTLDGAAVDGCASPFTTPALADGEHTFTVVATDAAGNQGPPATRKWVVDTTPPVVDVTGPTGTVTETQSTFDIKSSKPGRCLAYIDESTNEWKCEDKFTTPALADGPHTLVVVVTDAAGNKGSDSISWTIDTTP